MTWVAWRVQRMQYLVAAGVVVVLVLWLVASGLDGHAGWSQYWNNADVYVLYALPGVLGLAIGASLIAFEVDRGTNRLALYPRASHGPAGSTASCSSAPR